MKVEDYGLIQDKKRYKFVYTYSKLLENFADTLLECQSCGNNIWVAHYSTGNEKLDVERVKLKCEECGQWFIAHKKFLQFALGKVG